MENIQGPFRANFLILERNRGISLHERSKCFICGNSFSGVGGSCLPVDKANVGIFWRPGVRGTLQGLLYILV